MFTVRDGFEKIHFLSSKLVVSSLDTVPLLFPCFNWIVLPPSLSITEKNRKREGEGESKQYVKLVQMDH